jgi:hypothetical protein
MDILHSELDEDMSPKVSGLLDFFVPAIWYALGLEGKFLQVNSDTLIEEFDALLFDLEGIADDGMPTSPRLLLDLCINEEMFMATSNFLEVYQEESTKKDKLTDAETSNLMFYLIAVSNVLSMLELDM